MSKPLAAIAGLFVGILLTWLVSQRSAVTGIMASENVQQEIYRLREEVGSLRLALCFVSGLLTAILAALIF